MWYLAQVEGEDPEDEEDGTTLLNFMVRMGRNSFIWGKKDQLRVFDEDILMKVSPVPVSSRYTGLNKKDLKMTEKLFLVQKLLIKTFFGVKTYFILLIHFNKL